MIYYVISLLSQIYVDGPILEAVQRTMIFNDSKHFVDMPLKKHPIDTLQAFQKLGPRAWDRKYLRRFLDEHFKEPGGELEVCDPVDWRKSPGSIGRVRDAGYRAWASDLHGLWRQLCRVVRDEVRLHPELNSILYVPHPFIVPGGRFRELYYWDTYWILKGLLFSEMYETAEGVIRNLAFMVNNYGLIPNGGRVYYLLRSQPPLFIPMVYDYYIATGKMDFVVEMLPAMEKEYAFWEANRATAFRAKGVTLFSYFRYAVKMKTPRPESWREDRELVEGVEGAERRREVWSHVASAAETGWDFSSRWFARDSQDMHTIRTMSIVPVDLNAFVCANSRMMAAFFEIAGNKSKAELYHNRYKLNKLAMQMLHWNETDGIWYDYDLESKSHVNSFYLSNALPVYARCYDDEQAPHAAHAYLQRTGALNFSKGIPTSLNFASEQQWDSSNAWPPLIHMTIEGFRTAGSQRLYDVARDLAHKWLSISYTSYLHTNAMFEKYNASSEDAASRGQGGEYEVQTGFGWTNGVVLDLLHKFASFNVAEEEEPGLLPTLADLRAWLRTALPYVLFFTAAKFVRLYD